LSGLLAQTTLNTLLPYGSVLVPSGARTASVSVPVLTWADAVVVASVGNNGYLSTGNQWCAYALPNDAQTAGSIVIEMALTETKNVVFNWALFSLGTYGNAP